MDEEKEQDQTSLFASLIGAKQARKIRARERGDKGLWMNFSAFGAVGWSIALPTVLGAALGIWLDSRLEGPYSWTLMLLSCGLFLGIFSAWKWIESERQSLEEEKKKAEEDTGEEDEPGS